MAPVFQWCFASVRAAGWAPVAVFAAHVLSSRVIGLYRAFPPLDIPMHVAGGVAIAFFFWRSLHVTAAKSVVGRLGTVATALLSFTAVGTSTVIWEFVEWLSDMYFGTHAQLGLDDTLLDMLLGLVGGLGFVLAAALRAAGQEHEKR